MLLDSTKTSISNLIQVKIKQLMYITHYRFKGSYFYVNYFNNSRLKKFLFRIYNISLGDNFSKIHTIFIETLTACNLRCSYCPNSVYERGLVKNNQNMEMSLFKKIIQELKQLRWVGEIQPHSYGEPLLDKRLPELCKYTKDNLPDCKISIISNGELMTINHYLKLIESGVDRFKITQHLEKEPKGVLSVLDYREKNGDSGVEFTFARLKHINNRGGLVDVKGGKNRQQCNWPDYHLGISFDGQVLFCCNDYLNEVKIGNVKDDKIIDLWNTEYYKTIRKDIRESNFNLDICKNCSDGAVYS